MFLKYVLVHVNVHFQVHPAQILPLFPTCGRQAIFTAGHRAQLIIIFNHHCHLYDHDNHCHHHHYPQERPLGSPTITASDQRARSHSGDAKVKTLFFTSFFSRLFRINAKATANGQTRHIRMYDHQYLIVAGREGDSWDKYLRPNQKR